MRNVLFFRMYFHVFEFRISNILLKKKTNKLLTKRKNEYTEKYVFEIICRRFNVIFFSFSLKKKMIDHETFGNVLTR